jgi:hypothetical protein
MSNSKNTNDFDIKNIELSKKKKNKALLNKEIIITTPYLYVLNPLYDSSVEGVSYIDTLCDGENKIRVQKHFDLVENFEKHISTIISKNKLSWTNMENVTYKCFNKGLKDKKYPDQKYYNKWPIVIEKITKDDLCKDSTGNTFDIKKISTDHMVSFTYQILSIFLYDDQIGAEVNVTNISVKKIKHKKEKEVEKEKVTYVFGQSNSSNSSSESSSSSSDSMSNNLKRAIATESKPLHNKNINHKNNMSGITWNTKQDNSINLVEMLDDDFDF